MTTYLQELLDYHSSSRWNAHALKMNEHNEGRKGYERIIPGHVYDSMETIEPHSEHWVNDAHEVLWNVSKMKRKRTIYLSDSSKINV